MIEKAIQRYSDYIPHPNRISVIGGGVSLFSIPVSFVEPVSATCLFMLGIGADALDGIVARALKKKTIEGAILDPLVDKVRNFGMSVFMLGVLGNQVGEKSSLESFLMYGAFVGAIGSNFVVDYLSQKQRGDILRQFATSYGSVINPETCRADNENKSKVRANGYGKFKTALQCTAGALFLGHMAGSEYLGGVFENFSPSFVYGICAMFGASAVCGYLGLKKRK